MPIHVGSLQPPEDEQRQASPDGSLREHTTSGTTSPLTGAQPLTFTEIKKLTEDLLLCIDKLEIILPPIGKLATVKQAAKCLAVSPRTIRTQLYLGRWPGYRVGRAVRVDPTEIRKLMKKEFVP